MFWRKPNPDFVSALEKISILMTLIEKRLSSLEVEIDALKLRWKKKLVPVEKEESSETSKYNDGFDSVRGLDK